MERISREVERGRNFCLHAPTGFGKTPVVLAAILPLGFPVIWVTRTGNQADRPVEELKVINERSGADFLGLSFRGKRDMCPVARERRGVDYEALKVLCRKCRLNRKLNEVPMETMTFSEIYALGKRAGVCPYRIQLEMAKHVDLISMSYNYVFSDLIFMIEKFFRLRNAILVVDEAHNLQKIVGELNSEKLTRNSIARAAKEAKEFGTERSMKLSRKIRALAEYVKTLRNESTFAAAELLKKLGIGEEELRYGVYIGAKIYEMQLEAGKPLRSYVRRFSRFWQKALELEGVDGVALLQSGEGFEIFDMRAAEILQEIWKKFHACIFMSGTLKPVEAFAETVGLGDYIKAEVPSFASNVHAFIVRGVSTRGEELTDVQREKYRFLIHGFFSYPGNVAVFTSSYRVQEELMEFFVEASKERGKELFVENENLRGTEARRMLEDFRQSENAALIGPCGGRFAEGADFPGRALEAIMVIGIPFDRVTLKTQLYIQYYTGLYGERGRYYAYVVPALRRASQALGRAIRSPQDFGFFVLADERYFRREYFELLPDYIQRNVRGVHYSNFPLLMQHFFQ